MRRDLTEPELRDLAALALVLFPPTDRVPADLVRSTARGWVQGRMRRMRFPPPYRAGLTELAEAARSERDGSRFAALARGDAERAVARLWDDASGAFGELAADLLEGLYTSLPGWRLVGYPAGPGAPAGTRAYTEAPDPA